MLGVVLDRDNAAMLRPHEALGDRLIEKRQQCVEVSGYVENAEPLAMQAELTPGPDL